MHNNQLNVFVISEEALFLKLLKEQLATAFPNLDSEMFFLENAEAALEKMTNAEPHIVLAPTQNLGMSAKKFEESVERLSGQVQIIFFGNKETEVTTSPFLVWPLVESGLFIDLFQDFIPEEIKQKSLIFKKENEIYNLLLDYGKKFSLSVFEESKVIAMIPVQNIVNSSDYKTEMKPKLNLDNLVSNNENENLGIIPHWWIFESGFVLILTALCVASYFYFDEKYIFSIFLFFNLLSIFSFFNNRSLMPKIKKGLKN